MLLDREPLSFAEFQPLLGGLLNADDTRLWRRFAPRNDRRPGGDDE